MSRIATEAEVNDLLDALLGRMARSVRRTAKPPEARRPRGAAPKAPSLDARSNAARNLGDALDAVRDNAEAARDHLEILGPRSD